MRGSTGLNPASTASSANGCGGEGALEVETNASQARAGYLEALSELQARFREALRVHGGELVICRTDTDPVRAVRSLLRAAEGRNA